MPGFFCEINLISVKIIVLIDLFVILSGFFSETQQNAAA